ncbi:MAG: hypothetical protein HXY34_02710 [Candidatus Thorarchaeota archaeon]|nr:hypothetical protein [Candidatus Thorarchaeota archaeon]
MPGKASVRRSRRGYPVAVLLGLDDTHAVVWIVQSESIRLQGSISLPTGQDRSGSGLIYDYYNTIMSSMRPILESGVGSLVIAGTGSGVSSAEAFVGHVRKHHSYLLRTVRMASIKGDVMTPNAARAFVKSPAFQKMTAEVVDQESIHLLQLLDEYLYDTSGSVSVLFSLEEIDSLLKGISRHGATAVPSPEWLLLTDSFWNRRKNDPLFQRVMSVAKNAGVKTRVLRNDDAAGERVSQIGGVVCLARKRSR